MPNLLAIDTSLQGCSAALLYENNITTLSQLAQRQQAILILPMIDQLLQQACISLQQLDAIAYGHGPGSFTGIRLASSIAQGLAFGVNRPLITISSMQILAQTIHAEFAEDHVLIALNAYKDQIYWGAYQADIHGWMESIMPDQRFHPKDIPTVSAMKNWVGAGEGWSIYSEALQQQVPLKKYYSNSYPQAKELVRLAQRKYAQNDYLNPALALPNYLYGSEQWKSL